MKVLVVDEDSRVLDALQVWITLQWQDVDIITAGDGEAGFERFCADEPDIVLLSGSLPNTNGFEVLQGIRRVSDVPVIMLNGSTDEIDEVRGLEIGADDCIGKPISYPALMARIKAVLRRAEFPPPLAALPDYQAGALAIHFQNREVTIDGQAVKLTGMEYKLLYHLVRNAGHVMSNQALMDRVWGFDNQATPEYVKVFISRLRAKLREAGAPEFIQTERARGYRFVRA
jgi:two-component system, OmpR family, KDP operon response regulator KdpE